MKLSAVYQRLHSIDRACVLHRCNTRLTHSCAVCVFRLCGYCLFSFAPMRCTICAMLVQRPKFWWSALQVHGSDGSLLLDKFEFAQPEVLTTCLHD